ncbi:uncharacterized protein [Henckelia pumila]|uniref:uncharacterized protein n=1 Tax=Henckelia pumila TaxID=405737 RepID=UPI003C6E2DF5
MVGTDSKLSGSNPSDSAPSLEGGNRPNQNIAMSDSLQITIHRFNGKNYLEWAQSVCLVIDGKGKLGNLNGEIKPPASNDPKYKQWLSENSLVTAWFINSMGPIIGKPFMFLSTARDLSEAVKETYSDMENHSQLFELNIRMWRMQQGNRDVTAYYNEMMTVWQELDLFEEEKWENTNDSIRYTKKVERSRVFVFLTGLNKELDEVRGRILGRKPLPSIREVFSDARREEARRQVMLKGNEEPKIVDREGSALVAKGTSFEGDKPKIWCERCHKPWHTVETCWKIHGKPANYKKKSGSSYKATNGGVQALQTSGIDSGQQ